MFKKIISLFLSLSLIVTQPIFAQGVAQLNLAQYLGQMHPAAIDSFRPTQLRYFSYDNLNNSFRILLDKGDAKDIKDNQLKEEAKELMDYFLIGLALPNDTFWVNLRPDSPDNIIDPALEKTDLGRILLEADLQLKKDTSSLTSPQTSEGKAYWDKLYKKAGELFGTENITIPTVTRPWIVPGEIIVRESGNSAYIYKAALKVMLEEDYLRGMKDERRGTTIDYNFPDPRMKELNKYSTELIRELIIPKLIQEVNSSKRYAKLRQVYYSLVLSRWFKQKYSSLRSTRASARQSANADYISRIDSGDLTNLTAKEPYDKLAYFKQYQESFAQGEYNLKEPVYTPYGQSIRTYMSGGFNAGNKAMIISGVGTTVGSSIAGKSLENTANTIPLKVSGNNGQVTFSKQELSLALAASPLTVGMVKSTIKTNMDAFNKKYGKYWDKELKELYAGFDPISTYEELTKWIDKAKNYVEIAQKGSGMIDILENIKKEISRQNKPSTASPLGKKLPGTDRYGRPLRYVYYWELSDGEKNSLLEAFRKSFTEWGIKPADKNLRFAVRVNRANKIVAVVGALQYNIDTKEVGIIIVPEGVDKALEIESSLRETYIEEIRQGARFWDNTFSSTAGSSPLTVAKLRKDLASINSQLKRINKIVIELSRSHNSKMQNIANRLRLSMVKMNEMQKEAAFLNNDTVSKRDVLIWADRCFTLKDRIEFVEYYAFKLNKNKEMMDINEKLTILKNDIAKVLKEVKALYYSYQHNNSSSGVIENKGGIDFTDQAMRIGLEPMGSFADLKLVLPEVSNAAAIDLDNEFKQIQLMASSGIRPSDIRILEFAAACYYREEFGTRMGEITSCLQQAHFLDERLGRESSEALRLATMLPEVM